MLAFPLFCPKTRFCLSLPLALLKKRNEKRKVTFENEKKYLTHSVRLVNASRKRKKFAFPFTVSSIQLPK